MRIRFLLMGLALMGVGVQVQAQSCSKPAGSYGLWGGLVVDKVNKLAWQRCSVGQSWNGSSCAGTATGYYFSQAAALPVPASAKGFQWQLPSLTQLQSLSLSDAACSPAIDQVAFPQTVPSYYWTSQALSGYGMNNAYCWYFGSNGTGFDNCYANNGFYTRFVSALPPGYTDPAAPTGISFNIDDTGNYLVVLGNGFSENPADNLVSFPGAAGVIGVTPEAATETQLRVAIPDQATTGTLTVTTYGLTSSPSRNTLRVVNSNAACTAAGFTAMLVPRSTWQYCVLQAPAGKTYSDRSGDILIIGASAALPPGQTSYTASTSILTHSMAATVALKSTIVIKYEASGLYGELLVNKTSNGEGPDTFVNQNGLHNFGLILNRGIFNNKDGMRNMINGVVANTGTFNNQPQGSTRFVLATTATALSSFYSPGASFMNVSESDTAPRATLNNSGQISTVDGGIPALLNDGGDVVNNGTLNLKSIQAVVNKTGALQPSVISNAGTLNITIAPHTQKPVVENQAGATFKNLANARINNVQASWTFYNAGVVTQCGSSSGANPAPVSYAPCP